MRRAALVLALAACHHTRPEPPSNQATPPPSGPIAVGMTVDGTAIDVALTNTGATSQHLAAHIGGGDRRDYDWLRVDLTDDSGAVRQLGFTTERSEMGYEYVDLAPRAVHHERIELAWWAAYAHEPLAPGEYTVHAVWGDLGEATTTMVVPAVTEGCEVSGHDGLELLAYQIGGGGVVVNVGLHNGGTAPICVNERIQTHEVQSDWLGFQLEGSVIEVNDARDKSAAVTAWLEPGATAWRAWDVAGWALRDRNGNVPIAPGGHRLGIYYEDVQTDLVISAP